MKKEHDGKRKVFLRMVMFVCIAVFVHPLSASADVIFEPENNFYERHSDECSYFDRSCLAGADTYLWDAPNLTTEGGKLQKGDSIYISFVYTDNDGLEWGLAETQDKWILMADLYLEYGSPEFMEEYSGKYMKMSLICFQTEQYLYHGLIRNQVLLIRLALL